MGKGNVCVFGPYEGLYYIDNDDLLVYRPKSYDDDDEGESRLLRSIPYEELENWRYCDIDTEQYQDDVLEEFKAAIRSRFKGFTTCDKWLGGTQHAILQNGLFYIAIEDNEWSLAVKLLQKEPEWNCDSWLLNLQKRHYKRYLEGIRDALLEQFESIGTYKGAWTSGTITREEVKKCEEKAN